MTSKLINCRFRRPNASVRLFCFPWAGGGSTFYANWGSAISEDVEVIGFTLPGRESRFAETPLTKMSDVVDSICKAINSGYANKPFAIFGHSMGALIAFEVAKRLKVTKNLEPLKMYISGISGPSPEPRNTTSKRVCDSTDKEFIEYLRGIGGTPSEILDNEDMMSALMPMLRADYGMVDDYNFNIPENCEPVLTCSIDVFGGKDDIKRDYEAWKNVTSAKVTVTMRDGDHFYLKDPKHVGYFHDLISQDLNVYKK